MSEKAAATGQVEEPPEGPDVPERLRGGGLSTTAAEPPEDATFLKPSRLRQ